MELVQELLQGSRRALARLISLVENNDPRKERSCSSCSRIRESVSYRDYRGSGCGKKLAGGPAA